MYQISCLKTPKQNGVAKQKHGHLVEIGFTILFYAIVPFKLWLEAFLIAAYLINRLLLSPLKSDTPYF